MVDIQIDISDFTALCPNGRSSMKRTEVVHDWLSFSVFQLMDYTKSNLHENVPKVEICM